MRIIYLRHGNDVDFGDDVAGALRHVVDDTFADGQLERTQERVDNLLKVVTELANALGSDRRAAMLNALGFDIRR